MKILVTGSTGFVGNALIKRLSSEGYNVIGLYHNKKPVQKINNVFYFMEILRILTHSKMLWMVLKLFFIVLQW